jgi:hypothetical protein
VILQQPRCTQSPKCVSHFEIRHDVSSDQASPRGDSFPRVAGFPIGDAIFVEIEHQFGYTPLYVLVHFLDCSVQKGSRYLQALLFLAGGFLDEVPECRMTKEFTHP